LVVSSGLGSHRLANGCIVGSEDLDGLGSEAIQTTDIRSIHHDLLPIVVLAPDELASSDVVELGWNGHDVLDYGGVGGMSSDDKGFNYPEDTRDDGCESSSSGKEPEDDMDGTMQSDIKTLF
jgi:hypothetical protein